MNFSNKPLLVPYTAEEMFALVADVERYPEFVPGYREARVTRREGNDLSAVQRIGIGPVTTRFHSRATFDPPRRITVRSRESPFNLLEIDWEFEPCPGGCRIVFRARADLDGGVATRFLRPWFDSLADLVPAAFVRRAIALYGQREGPGPT